MGSMYIMNARNRIKDKIDEELNKVQGLGKKIEFLRCAIYDLVQAITDEETLADLEKTFP